MRKLLTYTFICTISFAIQPVTANTAILVNNVNVRAFKYRQTSRLFRSYSSLLQYASIRAIKGIDSANAFYKKEMDARMRMFTDYLPLTGGTLVGQLQINYGSDNNVFIAGSVNGNGRFNIGTDASANVYVRTTNSVDLRMGVGTYDNIVLKDGGNVGIGTNSPTASLHITAPFTANQYATQIGFSGVAGFTERLTSTSGQPYVTYTFNNGNVGIGVDSLPSGRLEVKNTSGGHTPSNYLQLTGTTTDNSNYPGISFKGGALAVTYPKITLGNGGLSLALHGGNGYGAHPIQMSINLASNDSGYSSITFEKNNGATITTLMALKDNGNVGIGTTSPSEKLSVNGNISAKKLTITQIGWSDYVFNEDYQLRSLPSLESFIRKNKHLPEMPSAKEVEEKGISVGDNQALLLKKIEELTLYLIEMKKENDSLQKQLDRQSRQINSLVKKAKNK
jgi:hypothetical protein